MQAVPVAQLMAKCLARPEMAVAETVLEYFNALDYVLMADRDPVLRAPLYRDLLPSLLRHARYPEGFATWDDHVEDDRDEDSFKRFRCRTQLTSKYATQSLRGPRASIRLHERSAYAPHVMAAVTCCMTRQSPCHLA